MLAVHPEIHSFPESKFFLYLVSLPEERSHRYAFGLIAPRLRPMLHQFLEDIGHPEMRRHVPMLPLIRLYTGSFAYILNHVTSQEGKRIWLEKTPDHLRYIKYIERFMPEAKIIHVIRTGSNVVASLYDLSQTYPERWGRYFKNLDACIDRWTEDVAISRRYCDRSNHAFVRYEELVNDPHRVLRQLCQFIGVEFNSQMVEGYAAAAPALIRGRETWKVDVMGAIRQSSSDKFNRVLNDSQQQRVLQRLADVSLDWI
jgi:hypothetical protein